MNLRETLEAVRSRGIEMAFDPGVHAECRLETNCPRAIELRKLIGDAGITLTQLLEGYVQSTANPVNINTFIPQIPNLSARVPISIGGHTVELDLTDTVRAQIQTVIRGRLAGLDEVQERVKSVGKGLFDAYQHEIDRVRTVKVLPALEFDQAELLRSKCMYTKAGKTFVFFFPQTYAPETIHHNGYLYQIRPEHQTRIKRDCLVKIVVEGRAIHAPTLCKLDGSKQQHYHGNNMWDCWGNVQLPTAWNSSLTQLYRLSIQLIRALGTVNYDSPLNVHPEGMPVLADLFNGTVQLGREGVPTTAPTALTDEPAPFTPHVGWGRGRR